MHNLIEYIAVAAAGYVFGSIPWAFIIGKLNGMDIRQHGSGNVGATNVYRVLGKKWGVACFILDFLKGLLPILSISLLALTGILNAPDLDVVLVSAAAVAGHMCPIFLRFKGGKGISTIAGIIAALAPLSFLTAGTAWWLIFHFSRYVSLASISASFILAASAWTFSAQGWTTTPHLVLIMLTALSALAVIRHSGNIKRLLSGTESKFGRKTK